MVTVPRRKRDVYIWEPIEGWRWTEDALCATHPNPDWWISEDLHERRMAAEACESCPCVMPCLNTVMSFPVPARHGVWGAHIWIGHPEPLKVGRAS